MFSTSQAGSYSVPLSNGTTANVPVSSIPSPVDLSSGWSLKLDSYGPGAGPSTTDPYSQDPTVSSVTTVNFAANALGTWTSLPATADQLTALGVTAMSKVSGIGTYTK